MTFTSLTEHERESQWRVQIGAKSPVSFYPLAKFDTDKVFQALKISKIVLTSLNVFEDGFRKENLNRFDVNSFEGTEIPEIMNQVPRSSPIHSEFW